MSLEPNPPLTLERQKVGLWWLPHSLLEPTIQQDVSFPLPNPPQTLPRASIGAMLVSTILPIERLPPQGTPSRRRRSTAPRTALRATSPCATYSCSTNSGRSSAGTPTAACASARSWMATVCWPGIPGSGKTTGTLRFEQPATSASCRRSPTLAEPQMQIQQRTVSVLGAF